MLKDWNKHYRRITCRMFRRQAAGCWAPDLERMSAGTVWSVAWGLTYDLVYRTECWLWRPRKMWARGRMLKQIRRHEARRMRKWEVVRLGIRPH